MEIEYNGIKRKVNIIGGFTLKEKTYAVCSYADEENNYKIVIVQVIKDSTEMHIIDIPAEDREEVIQAYEEMKNYITEEEEEYEE